MTVKVISVLAPADWITRIRVTPQEEGVELDEPMPAESYSDAADAPLGPQDVQTGLQLLTVELQTAAATMAFASTLISLKGKLGSKQSVKIIDPKTGRTLLTMDESTPDSAIRKPFEP